MLGALGALGALLLLLGPALGAVVPPSWADPRHNPCAAQPGGWQLLLWPADGRCYRIFRRGHPCPPSMELTPGVGPGGAPGCRCPPGAALLAGQGGQGGQAAGAALCHPLLEQGPCPPGQYLAPLPAAPSEDRVPSLRAACRAPDACPPGHVFWARDGRCYPRLSRGPCYRGELLVAAPAPSPRAPGAPLGACRCEPRGELARFYSPLTKTCHEHFTPGPCQEKGLLFLPAGLYGGLGHGQCGCSPELPHYHPATGQCYQIDTIGPCPAGHRFSPPAGGPGGAGGRAGRAQCRCKGGHVPWVGRPPPPPPGEDAVDREEEADDDVAACYRPWTRGPCPAGQLLSDASQCVPAPCRPGRLYFPDDKGCYKVGVRGPCPKGQVVLFETAVRPALEGISYRGVCGCTGPTARSSSNDIAGQPLDQQDNRCVAEAKEDVGVKRSSAVTVTAPATAPDSAPLALVAEPDCAAKAGMAVFNGTCQALYSQGPCPLGQWLVPQRRGREGRAGRAGRADGTAELELWSDADPEARAGAGAGAGAGARSRARWPRARCDCRPGHKPVLVAGHGHGPATATAAANSSATAGKLECQPPAVVLATFLNSRGFAGT